jgi:hypothetical protein
MAATNQDRTGWFTITQVAAAMQLGEQEFLRAYIQQGNDELNFAGEPQVHWLELVKWAENYFTERTIVSEQQLQHSVEQGFTAEEAERGWREFYGQMEARELLEGLLGLDDWSDGVTNRVATNWNLTTHEYEVISNDTL